MVGGFTERVDVGAFVGRDVLVAGFSGDEGVGLWEQATITKISIASIQVKGLILLFILHLASAY